MVINNKLLDELTEQAKINLRLRQSLDLRNTPEDLSQRILNAIEPGSVVPIHRHRKSSETILCIRGILIVEFYDELERICTESVVLAPNSVAVAVNIPVGQWHTVHAEEIGTVILEAKDGKYEPTGPEDILTI